MFRKRATKKKREPHTPRAGLYDSIFMLIIGDCGGGARTQDTPQDMSRGKSETRVRRKENPSRKALRGPVIRTYRYHGWGHRERGSLIWPRHHRGGKKRQTIQQVARDRGGRTALEDASLRPALSGCSALTVWQ